jgi:Fe-S cluster biogenesis protein NfuA
MENKDLIDRIQSALAGIRPFLQQDGGDVEFLSVDDQMNVALRLLGNCRSCAMSPMTMKAGIEEAIKKVAPEVVSVQAITS